MNRLSFLKKLSVGIAAAVITPKVLLPSQKAVLTTGGVIPHIANAGKGKYYGIIVAKKRRSGANHSQHLFMQMQQPMEDIQMNWLKLQVALNKAKHEQNRT